MMTHGTESRREGEAGNLDKEEAGKLILAPLQGFTDVVYRNVFAGHFSGFDEAVAPFISTMGEERLKPSRIHDVLPENNKSLKVTPQILGNVAKDFIFLANILADMGYETVNWNLGCPHSKIAKKKRGSGLLNLPDMIDAFLDVVMGKISCRLSVKVRLGRKSPDEIFRLLPLFDAYPLEEIIVHPRTGVQMYLGEADADAFEAIAEKTRHTLVYNGDITGKAVFNRLEKRFPMVKRFMIGRGVLANPFLPEDIKGINPGKTRTMSRLVSFHEDLFETYDRALYGPSHITGRMKGFWTYLGPSFEGSKKPLKRILKTKNRQKYIQAVQGFFSEGLRFSPPG